MFSVANSEALTLEEKFGNLCNYAAWALFKRNTTNNHTEDIEDIIQELKFSLITAGCYYKRQVYIESCLAICKRYLTKKSLKKQVEYLQDLWDNRTKHGAGKQKFVPIEEKKLDQLIEQLPEELRPSKEAPLKIDALFTTYCKAIIWNRQKTLGKKITKEREIRRGLTSLSEYDYLGVKV